MQFIRQKLKHPRIDFMRPMQGLIQFGLGPVGGKGLCSQQVDVSNSDFGDGAHFDRCQSVRMPWLSEVPMGPFDSDDHSRENCPVEVLQRTHYSGSITMDVVLFGVPQTG